MSDVDSGGRGTNEQECGPTISRAPEMLRFAYNAFGQIKVGKTSLLQRFSTADRPELEQAALRVVIVGLVLGYLTYHARASVVDAAQEVAWVALATFLFSLTLFARILYAGGASVSRRIVGMIVDNAATSYCLLQMEETGAIIIGVYLFVTFGNGFRYGRKYLHLSQAMSLAGFGSVIVMSEYWRSHPSLSVGLVLALVVLPFYVAVLAQRITEAMRKADEANRAKGRFLANMSHEMRTPLNGVIAMADVLRETRLNQSQVEIVETMTTSAQLLLAQIEDVLDMAKIEAGRVAIECSPFDLSRLLTSTVKVLLPQARYKALDFKLEIQPGTDRWFVGDSHHLRQVVLNLVSNAIKFTERGSVRVISSIARRQPGVWVRIEVRDTGVGIPAEKRAMIFEPFTQADNSITRVYGGTGLGTTIARNLVLLMGGEIGLESEVGVGTLFWIEIPLSPAEEQTPEEQDIVSPGMRIREQASGTFSREARVAQRARVLVAEDNATNRRVTQLILESRGHSIHMVDNGEKALDALERETFDIALFDLSMPVVSGIEALKMYRFSNRNPIPVLILSANVTPDAIEECYGAGASEFIPKPLRASQLLDAIDRHLAGSSISKLDIHPATDVDQVRQLSLVQVPVLDEAVYGELCRLSSDPTFVDRLLRGFWVDAERLVRELTQSIERGRFEAVRDAAHALKGGAASVGAKELAQLALRIEKASHESLRSRTAQWTSEIGATAERARMSIDGVLALREQGKVTPH